MEAIGSIPVIDWICLGIGGTIGLAIIKWVIDSIRARQRARISEIRLDLKGIVDSNANKSLDDLIVRANERDNPGDSSDTP